MSCTAATSRATTTGINGPHGAALMRYVGGGRMYPFVKAPFREPFHFTEPKQLRGGSVSELQYGAQAEDGRVL